MTRNVPPFRVAIVVFCLAAAAIAWSSTPEDEATRTPPKRLAPLSKPSRLPFDATEALGSAHATADASIERHGPTVRVHVCQSGGRPGVVFQQSGQTWDLKSHSYLQARVKNVGRHSLSVHLALDNPDADRTRRRGCAIASATLLPGKETTLRVAIVRRATPELASLFRGMRAAPGGIDTRQSEGLDPANVACISVYVYQPRNDYAYEVSGLAAGGTPAFPLPERLDDLFPMIDRFGQYMHKDWPGKTHSEGDLAQQRAQEAADLEAHPGPTNWNRYGGWNSGPQLAATGRFRVAKWRGKWWLVDPTGRLFWSHGLVRVTWSGGYTPISDREFLFATLPGPGSPFTAFYGRSTWGARGLYPRGVQTYNVTGANLLCKYGPHWQEAFADVSHRRLRSWGLNTIANCSQPAIYLARKTPYTATVYSLNSPPADTPGSTGYVATIHRDSRPIAAATGGWGNFPDVFDPAFKATLLAEVAQHRGKAVGDPWCLGYFLGNELSWGHDETWLAAAVLQSPADQPAKIAFVGDLKEKYQEIERLNAVWHSDHDSWGALLRSTTSPDVETARADLAAFLDKTADAYFRQCREAVKQTDPDGLYLGCRFAGWANERIFLAAARYSDVISVNRYAESIADLRLPGGLDKPVLIGEFHFGALDRGKFHATLRPVADQKARAAAYEKYVRSALENPWVVGTHWHQYGDQATTGRDDGENFQNGFIDVCDTPYVETIDACRRVGYELYDARAR